MNTLKKIQSKPQSISIIYPPGFAAIALNEITFILKNLWVAKPFKGKILPLKNEIKVQGIYLLAITELLLRSRCLTDIRLIIHYDICVGKKTFEKVCRELDWSSYVSKNISIKIKSKSVASQLFHENLLKETLASVLGSFVKAILSGDQSDETTSIYVNLYKNKLTVSISLAGELLYKRGYRESLHANAPLREDFAACAIEKLLIFIKDTDPLFIPKNMLIPFSGTGTFIFEFLINYLQFPPGLLGRDYAIQKLPFFKKEYFEKIFHKYHQNTAGSPPKLDALKIYSVDNSDSVNQALLGNMQKFNTLISNFHVPHGKIVYKNENFFTLDVGFINDNCLIFMNPPYGMRLNKNINIPNLYKNIAKKINEISQHLAINQHIAGIILCPTEEAWLAFRNKLKNMKNETYHFTQGGLDIRVCQFYN